jgi:hypothetical protein
MEQDLSQLISYLQSQPVTVKNSNSASPARPASGTGGVRGVNSFVQQKSNFSDDLMQGATNVTMGLLRGISGLGRGVTNAIYGALPAMNEAGKIAQGGIQPNEYASYAGTVWDGFWGGLGGFTKGVLYSGMPVNSGSRKVLTDVFGGQDLIEGAYDLITSDDFKETVRQNPGLKGLTSEETLFTLPKPFMDIPFLGIDSNAGLPVTSAGLTSFAADVFLDPASYFTLGIAGGLKGASSGVSKLANSSKEIRKAGGREAVSAQAVAANQATTFYKTLKEDGTWANKRTPLEGNFAYNAQNTNPFVFMAKETSRGFMEAHKFSLQRRASIRQNRMARKNGDKLFDAALRKVTEAGGDVTDEAAMSKAVDEVLNSETMETQMADHISKKFKVTEDSAEQIALIRQGEIKARMAAAENAKRQIPFAAERAARLAEQKERLNPERTAVVQRAGEARRIARGVKNWEDFTPRVRPSKNEPELTNALADNLAAANGVEGGDISSAWNAFAKEAIARDNAPAITSALRDMFSIVGHREFSRGSIAETDPKKLRTLLSRDSSGSAEMAKLKGLIKTDATRLNPKATAGKGVEGSTAAMDSAINEGVSTVAAKLFGITAYGDEFEQVLLEITERIKNGEDFGPILNEAFGGQTRVFAERLRYAAERDVSSISPEASLIDGFKGEVRNAEPYSPYTLQIGMPTISSLPTASTRNAARVLSLLHDAGTNAYSAELSVLLKKAGAKNIGSSTKIIALALDVAHATIFLKGLKAKRQMTLKIFNTKLGKLNLSDSLAPEVRTLNEESFGEFEQIARKIAPGAESLSDAEVSRIVEIAGTMKNRQFDANAELQGNFRIPLAGNGSQLRVLGSTDQAVANRVGRTGISRYAPTRAADEIGKIDGAFGDVETKIGFDADGNLNLARTLKNVETKIKTPEGKKLLASIRELIYKKSPVDGILRSIKIPKANQQLIMEVKRDIGNLIAESNKGLPVEDVPGFSEIFRTKRGGVRVTTISSFMARAYHTSRMANSRDGGRFADYVDESLLGGRELPENWTGRMTTAERAKVLRSYSDKWGGEGLTPMLILDIRDAAKKARSGAGSATAKEKALFAQDVEEIIDRARDASIRNLAATPELRNFDSSSGWLNSKVNAKKKGEQKLSENELTAARDAYFSAVGRELTVEQWKVVEAALDDLAYTNTEFMNDLKYTSKAGDLTRGAKAVVRNRTVNGKLAYAMLQSKLPIEGTQLGVILGEVVRLGQRQAEDAVTLMRATTLMVDSWPASASALRLKALPDTLNIDAAYTAMQAEVLLAKTISTQDILVTRGNEEMLTKIKRLAKGTVEAEKAKFTRLLTKVDKKLAKQGLEAIPEAEARAMSFEEVIATGNLRTLIRHIPTMEVVTGPEILNWRRAMDELMGAGESGTKSVFKTTAEAVEAWKAKSPQIDDKTMLRILESYGNKRAATYLNKGKKPQRETILRWINDSSEMIEQSELQLLRTNNVFTELGMGSAASPDIKEIVDKFSPADAADMVRQLEKNFVDLITTAEESGNGWLGDLAISSLGDSVDTFFRLTENVPLSGAKGVYNITPRVPSGPKWIKPNRGMFTGYTDWRGIVSGVRQKAREMFPDDSLKQDIYTASLTIKALRIRENYYMLRGAVPASTPSRTRNVLENKMFESPLWKALDEEINPTPVFLSDADVLELLPPELSRDLLFIERTDSVPYTSVMEGARVLVAHMERLPAGSWFDETDYQTVYMHMYQNMVAEARLSSTSNAKTGQSWFDADIERGDLTIRKFIEYFLASTTDDIIEAPAFALFERHAMTRVYSLVAAKYAAANGQILGPIRDGWNKVMNSNIMSSGDKVAATIEAFSDLNKFMDLENISEGLPDFLARYDQLLVMSSELDREAVLRIALTTQVKAAVKDTAEVAGIKGVQAKSKAILQAQKDGQMAKSNARTDLLLDNLAQKEMEIRRLGLNPDEGEMIDQLTDTMTNGGFLNSVLDAGDRALTRFSWDYGMEDVRPVYGGAVRNSIRAESAVTNWNVAKIQKWRKVKEATKVDYPKQAAETFQKIPAANLREVLEALENISIGFNPRAKGKLALEATGKVAEDLAALRNMVDADGLKLFDDLTQESAEALVDVGKMMFHLFGDEGVFATQRAPGSFLNTLLRKIGANDQIGFNNNVSADSLGEAWRDMNFNNVFEDLNSLNFAWQETEKLRVMGIETMKAGSGRKLTDFTSLKDAEAAGYYKMNTIKELKADSGTEVMFFMDTDNYVYPAAMINQIRNFSNFVSLPYRGLGAAAAKSMQRFSRIQDFAKQMMTTMRPGNYMMNAIGAAWINDVAGVRNPMRYVESLSVMRTLGATEADLGMSLAKAEGAIDGFQAAGKESGNILKGDKKTLMDNVDKHTMVVKGKVWTLSSEQIGKAYAKYGGVLPYHQSMQLDQLTEVSSVNSLQKAVKSVGIKKAYAATAGFTGKLAAQRDDFFRMALFLDNLKKGTWNNLEEAFKDSLAVVDRFHPQPQGLSKGNYVVSRQFILFFTWRAKTLGLTLSELLDKPGRLLGYEKAYQNYTAMQGNETEGFGSHDPQGVPVRSFQQGNMGILSPDNQYSMSIANPMWDLMGSDGWLSKIAWDTNQSPQANAFAITAGTSAQVLYSSSPLIGNFLLNWAQGRTSNGQDLMRGGITDEDMPAIVSEFANSMGLSPYHAALAYFFPQIVEIQKGNWADKSGEDKANELMRSWYNWATGARAAKYLTPDNKKMAYSELKSLRKLMAERGNTTSGSTKESMSDLLDYLGTLGKDE